MRRSLLGSFAFAVLLASRSSWGADLAPIYHKAPIAPARSWTGFYAGINGGGSVSDNPSNVFFFGGVVPPPGFQFNETFHRTLAGAVFGGQAGYNWQLAPHWVVGVEVDGQWTNERNSACLFGCAENFFGPGPPGTGTFMSDDQNIKWVATARGRLGYAEAGWLAYVTGGAAWGRVDENIAVRSVGIVGFPDAQQAASFSTTKSGWTIGGGVEMSLWHSAWSAKLEYLYVNLGTLTNILATPAGGLGQFGTGFTASSFQVHDHILRVGLNYRLGGGGPVIARY